jgi:hypothetical protein
VRFDWNDEIRLGGDVSGPLGLHRPGSARDSGVETGIEAELLAVGVDGPHGRVTRDLTRRGIDESE